jgi:hypothetical protein
MSRIGWIRTLAAVVALTAIAMVVASSWIVGRPVMGAELLPSQELAVNTGQGSSVSSITVSNTPIRPGAPAAYTFDFVTSNELSTGQEILILFAKEFQVPFAINQDQVSISASAITGVGICEGIPSETVAPSEVSVAFVGEDNAQALVQLRVPDMNTSDVCPGNQGIDAGSDVTVIFRQAAGIRNPKEGNLGRRVEVRTTSDPDPTMASVSVPWMIELSNSNRSRGQELTVTGFGFRGQTTLWRDANADGVRQALEGGPAGICNTTANDDFVATCTFTVANPPFKPRFFDHTVPGANCIAGTVTACNYINAIDSRGNVVNLEMFANPQEQINAQTLDLRGLVTANPDSGRPGDTIIVQLLDFPSNEVLIRLDLGGVPVPINGSMVTNANGEAIFPIQIPNGVPPGVQSLAVATPSSTTRRADITVLGADLTLSHEEVIPNQNLTITGEGFSQGGNVCIAEGGISLAGVPLKIADPDNCPDHISPFHGVLIGNDGTFTLTARVHGLDNRIPPLLVNPGTYEFSVIDTNGSQGTINVNIPPRALEADPPAAPPGEEVTITGRRFIASNLDGLSAFIFVTYDCGGSATSQAASNPDITGEFQVSVLIPNGCTVPSTSIIRAETIAGGELVATDLTTHQVIDAPPPSEPDTHTLTLALAGDGSGTVTSDPEGISCPGVCNLEQEEGTEVTITATPDPDSAFSHWEGSVADASSASTTVSLDEDQTVTAVFTQVPADEPEVTFDLLRDLTREYVTHGGTQTALLAHLNNAERSLSRGQMQPARVQLDNYIRQVRDNAGVRLTHQQADKLIRMAEMLRP